MEKLKLKTASEEHDLLADEKIARGIYFVSDVKRVKHNIKELSIKIEENGHATVVRSAFTKIDKWGFLTIGVGQKFDQYIFMASAQEEDVQSYIRENVDDDNTQLKEMILLAYKLSKGNNFED